MAFTSFNTQFQRLGPVNDNGPTVWTYITTDPAVPGTGGQPGGEAPKSEEKKKDDGVIDAEVVEEKK